MKHINYRHNQYYGKSYQKHISENQHSVPSFSKTLSCLIQLHTAIGDRQCTKNHHIQTVYEQARYEVHEEFIVSLANAGAQPHTMMIETHDTIVAYIAMRSTLWSENHACFTEFEPIEHILMATSPLMINSSTVLLRYFFLLFIFSSATAWLISLFCSCIALSLLGSSFFKLSFLR